MKIYGIDYNKYLCGGINNQKLQRHGSKTLLFYTEKEMLNTVAELKDDYTIGEIVPFVTNIVEKQKYEF